MLLLPKLLQKKTFRIHRGPTFTDITMSVLENQLIVRNLLWVAPSHVAERPLDDKEHIFSKHTLLSTQRNEARGEGNEEVFGA